MEIVVVLGSLAVWLTPWPDPEEQKTLTNALFSYLGAASEQKQALLIVNGRESQVFLLDFKTESLEVMEERLMAIKAPAELRATVRAAVRNAVRRWQALGVKP